MSYLVLYDARQRSKDLLSIEIAASRDSLDGDRAILDEALEALELYEQCLAEKKVIKEGVLLPLSSLISF